MAVPYYPGSLYTPNLSLALYSIDSEIAENFVILDSAFGSGGSINVNGHLVISPNLSSTTPAAPGGQELVTFQYDVNGNISAYVPIPAAGGVTSFSGDSVVYNNAASTGAVTLSLIAQTANLVFAGPTSAGPTAPTFRALVAADIPSLPYGTGTVTSFSAGTLSPLFTTSVATSTTTPALSFSLSNAAGGTVFGNTTTGAAAPGYTIAPVLGIPGTSTGSIALASSTASGKYTITAPANAATPTLTLPTSSGVAVNVADGTVFTATIAATGTLALATQTANYVFSGPTSAGPSAPTFRALVSGDIPALAYIPTSLMTTLGDTIYGGASGAATRLAGQTSATKMYLSQTGAAGPVSAAPAWAQINYADITGTTPTPPSGSVLWSALGNAGGNLTLTNAGNTTTFNQTSAAVWLWANTTTGTSGTTNASPVLELAAQYYTGSVTGTDLWTLGSSLAAGTNGASTLTIGHSGSTGAPTITTPAFMNVATAQAASTSAPMLTLGGSTTVGVGLASTGYLGLFCAAGDGLEVIFGGTIGLLMSQYTAGTVCNLDTRIAGYSLMLSGYTGSTVTNPALTLTNNVATGSSMIPTSGTLIAIAVGANANQGGSMTFAPTSGTANFIPFQINPTINQTGGANGTVTDIMVNSVETAVVGTHNFIDLQAGSAGTTSKLTIKNSGVVSKYNAIATVSNGVPSELATSDLTAQSAAITATTLYATTATGMYRVSWSATITTASDISSVLGGTGGFQVLYTSPTDSVVKTTVPGNSVTSAANTTGTAVGGCEVVYAKTGTNIQFTYGYTDSHTSTAMVYELHLKVEAM